MNSFLSSSNRRPREQQGGSHGEGQHRLGNLEESRTSPRRLSYRRNIGAMLLKLFYYHITERNKQVNNVLSNQKFQGLRKRTKNKSKNLR